MQLDTPGQQNVETSWPPRCSLCSVSKCSFFGSGTRNVGIRQAAFVSLGVSGVSWTVCTEKQLNLLYVLKPGDLGGGLAKQEVEVCKRKCVPEDEHAFAGIDGVVFYWETTFEAELLCIVTDGCTFPADCTINLHVQLHSSAGLWNAET